MALAKKCDRCGNFYEHYGKEEYEPNGMAFIYKGKDCSFHKIHKIFDLCPDCLGKLDKFIRNVADVEDYPEWEDQSTLLA